MRHIVRIEFINKPNLLTITPYKEIYYGVVIEQVYLWFGFFV